MPGTSTRVSSTPSVIDRRARLRGSLAAESLGARGLERLARNPGCLRLEALAVAGISPATAARAVYGETRAEAQSPLAVQTGNRFEAALSSGDAARLVELFQRERRLDSSD